MRLKFLFSVSILALGTAMGGLMPTMAQAGFEFVPNNSAPPVSSFSAPDTAPMPVVPAPAVVDAPLPELPSPQAKSSAPIKPVADAIKSDDRPMDLVPAKKLVPLTPIAHDSDSLVVEASDAKKAPAPAVREFAPVMPAPKAYKAGDVHPLTAPAGEMPVEPVAKMAKTSGTNTVSTDANDAVIQGFGRDVPLALTLQQIVPANYRYSFDNGINPGMRVSWTGGQSWKNVIMEIARNNGMNVDIVSNVVAFHRPVPMDIVSSGISNDAPQDVVMGIPLRPVAAEKPVASDNYMADMAMPSPVSAPPVQGDSKPMALVPALQPDTKVSAPPVVADEMPAPVAKPVETKVAKVIPQKTETAKEPIVQFDSLLDDKPATASVKDKKIMTADAQKETLAAAREQAKAPVVLPPVGMENVDLPAAPAPAAKVADVQPAAAPMSLTAMIQPQEKPIQIAADLVSPQEWQARKGETLRQVLTTWSERAGVSLVWSSEYDYPLQTDLRMESGYADAVRTLLAGFSKAQPRPLGRLFKNTKVGAQPVLIVETQRLAN